ncbi:MAG: metallophosphoesterase [Gemmatimonadota bacterium]|nr:metallophosphoesterase [Gemmatimonadota bacterium]
MIVGFVGDLHGRVLHALALIATWQKQNRRRFDLLVQVGDMGAFPDMAILERTANRHFALDPSQRDFVRLMQADADLAEALSTLGGTIGTPVHFIRGNHEEFNWLEQLPRDSGSGTAAVDRFGLLRYVPDGTVMRFGKLRFAFLGGVEERSDAAGIDRNAYEALLTLKPGSIDVLVTHQGPYGSSAGFRGDIHGSRMITDLIERSRPTFHVAGHAHVSSGPTRFGDTSYLGLDCIVASPLYHPEAQGFQPGCLGVLDTDHSKLEPVTDDWLADFETPFDFDDWYERNEMSDLSWRRYSCRGSSRRD